MQSNLALMGISNEDLKRMNDIAETANQNNDSDSGANVGMHGVVMKRGLEALRESIAIQCADGNWNYDPYMHGMANGMLFALSLFEAGTPEYLEAPEKWLADTKKPKQKAFASGS